MKTKLLHFSACLCITLIGSLNATAQSLSTEYKDAVYEVSNLHGLGIQMISIDSNLVAYMTHSTVKANKIDLELEVINVEESTIKSYKEIVKGNYVGTPIFTGEKLVVPYASATFGPQNILLIDLKRNEFTPVVLGEYNKIAKKMRYLHQAILLNDKVYFTGATINDVSTLGIYDLVSESLEFKILPKNVKSLHIKQVEDKVLACYSTQIEKQSCTSTIGFLDDDLSLNNETTFLKGKQRHVSDISVTQLADGSYVIYGIWATLINFQTTYRPRFFWASWSGEAVNSYGEKPIVEVQLNSNLYTKDEKDLIKDKDDKRGSYRHWRITNRYTDEIGNVYFVAQNDRTSFALLNVNPAGELVWSNSMTFSTPEVNPIMVNNDVSQCFASYLNNDAFINVKYFEDQTIKSIDFSLDDGSIDEKNTSDKLMMVKGENKQSAPLNFGLRISNNQFLIYQAFESGSKFTLDNSEYTRTLYTRRVVID